MSAAALEVRDLVKLYRNRQDPGLTVGVRGVSLHIEEGEIVGLIGESGCGKSTLGRCVAKLADADSGQVMIRGQDFGAMRGKALRAFRKHVQYVFQRPDNSLNPRMTVAQFVGEAIIHYDAAQRSRMRDRLSDLAALVGLRRDAIDAYPHQLSGGEKQRVAIMRALACNPSLIVLDEPTSALDVSVQAQVLRALRDLQNSAHIAYLFISHDVAVIRYMCARVFVMYLGLVVEEGPTSKVFSEPQHPYTQALLSATPRLKRSRQKTLELRGELTDASAALSGCPLRPRCPHADERCRQMPPVANLGSGHRAACWLLS